KAQALHAQYSRLYLLQRARTLLSKVIFSHVSPSLAATASAGEAGSRFLLFFAGKRTITCESNSSVRIIVCFMPPAPGTGA
ncbi:MAG: hypothetical protein NTV89_03880, partial [Proteobacteria bacterium]|nr:hypothetical protein [Pseudomonadota bacterium]